jgi:predicted small metal-binding protein
MTPGGLQTREVRCADVHPVRCNVALRASSNEALSDRVRAHGARVHGFTPVWYSRERIAAITEACTIPNPR